MAQIQKAAVLGAGTMGSAIAAHIANAGTEVILLDIVPDDAGNDRNKLAKNALEKMAGQGSAERITPGNFEDDMSKLEECDWIIEAVIEKPEVKKDLFSRLNQYRKEGCIVSSNTSSIPLKTLKEGQSSELKNHLIIAHFFNPPQQTQLLELVSGKPKKGNGHLQHIIDFADQELGKTVIEVKDTPGFIGNRLGVFWMFTGLQQALEKNIPVPMADEIMGKKLGFPKTGIFGLFDMVGVTLMLELGRTLREKLPQDEAYQGLDKAIDFLKNMQEDSFYKKEKEKRLPLNLETGKYEEAGVYNIEDDLNLSSILVKESQAADYARAVLLRMLNYACACLPDIAESVEDADQIMRLGFNWQQGPFEIINTLGVSALISALEKDGFTPAPLLEKARDCPFYKTQKNTLYYLTSKNGYKPRLVSEDKWTLADKTRGTHPVLKNDTARLWDIGDGIACMQLTTKAGTINPRTFDFMHVALEKVESGFAGLIIGGDDRNFSDGLDLRLILEACEKNDWEQISRIIRYGQQTLLKLKRTPYPVVGAPSGRTLGGGCEILLHCDSIQAHSQSFIGLVETRIGLVPAWGGCTEMLLRHLRHAKEANSKLQGCEAVFRTISQARISSSAEEFKTMIASPPRFGITMNRNRLLNDAKQNCLSLVRNYKPPTLEILKTPQQAARMLFQKEIENKNSPHEKEVVECLAYILSGGSEGPKILGQLELSVMEDRMDDRKVPEEIDELHMMDLEHDSFMKLIKTKETQRKIKEVLQ